ncbi:MAG: hypothetical protein J6B62_02335 [Bacteroidales bacterium]|nr:hypothetical protein [Bacteroidales bacterium]
MKKALLLSFISIACLSGCIKDTFTAEDFINTTKYDGHGVILKERGRTILVYDPSTWQLSFNSTMKEFRVHEDQMKYYYSLKCDNMPSEEGQTIEGTLEWTTYDDSKSRHMTFSVSKIGTDGRIWLWNAKYQTGVVVVEVR